MKFSPRLVGVLAGICCALSLGGCTNVLDEEDTTAIAAPTATATPEVDATDIDVFDIAVGDCMVDDIIAGSESEVSGQQKKVDCSAPHHSEVYANKIMTGSKYPGTASVEAESEKLCEQEFVEFVGRPFDKSQLSYSYLYPTTTSWSSGDREILCLINEGSGTTVGTLRGAAR